MSARTAEYLRVMMTPKDPDTGEWLDPHPSIAALSRSARHLWEVLSNLAYSSDNAVLQSVETIAKRMKITPANVRRARAELTAAGVIHVDVGGGDRLDVNRYRFPLATPAEVVHTPRASARGTSSTPRAVPRVTPRGTARHQIPVDPLVTTSYAIDRGAPDGAEDDLHRDDVVVSRHHLTPREIERWEIGL